MKSRLPKRRFQQTQEERVRLVWTALELRVELDAYEEAPVRQLYRLHEGVVRRRPADRETVSPQHLAVAVVDLKAMAVALADLALAIKLAH